MSRKVLTNAAAMEIKRLYELEDQFGRKIHSQMEIASMLGVSETTVFRTIHKRGAYMALRDVPTETEAQESLKRFMTANPKYAQQDTALQKLQAAVTEVKELPKRVDAMLSEISTETIPRSPLDE